MPFSFLEPTKGERERERERERGGGEESRACLGEEKGEWHAVMPGYMETKDNKSMIT